MRPSPRTPFVLAYALLAVVYSFQLPLHPDEFQGAFSVDRLASGLPYADFTPYKNVLGYYLQLPILAMVPDPWWGLIASRLALVGFSSVCLYAFVRGTSRITSARAAALTLPVLVVMTHFLERGFELRVDMMAGWLGALGLLALLRGRPALAGLLQGLAFLVTQKAVYFGLATLPAVLLLDIRPRGARPPAFARWLIGGAIPVLAYIVGWSLVSSPGAVLQGMFGHAAVVAGRPTSGAARLVIWLDPLLRNPGFWALFCLGVVAAVRDATRARAAAAAGGVLLFLALRDTQPWPYFIASCVPFLAVVVAFGVERTIRWSETRPARRRAALAAYAGFGLLVPLAFVPGLLARSQEHQRTTVQAAAVLVPPGGTYLAGVEMLRHRRHVPSSWGWLEPRRVADLAHGAAEEEGLARLREDPPAVLIDNERIRSLGCTVRRTLDSLYPATNGNLRVLHGASVGVLRAGDQPRPLFVKPYDYWSRLDDRSIPPFADSLAAGCEGT